MADTSADKLKVFISYSRKDSAAFTDELVVGLEDRGFAPFLDRHDIKPGEPWETRLGALIDQSDTVVFVISPESIKSERCVWEVNKALGFSKRLLPVIYKSVPDASIPAKLSDLQFVRFDTASGMMRPLRELAEALRVDLEWIREHTWLGELAARWQSRNRSESLLLRGDDLVAAKAWSAKRKPDAPEITELQRSFLRASEQAEIVRAAQSKAAQRGTWRPQFSRTVGSTLIFGSTIILLATELIAVRNARTHAEGASVVIEADPNRIDPANEGKFVHVSGELKTTARLTDPDFVMSAEAALLVRHAEMYQWRESRDKGVSNKGASDKRVSGKGASDNDSCNRVWSAERLYAVCGEPEPPFRFPGMKVAARDATLGAFRPGILVLEQLPATIDLPVDSVTVEAARTHVDGPAQLSNGALYLGSNPARPQIGDLRMSWRIAKTGPVSLMGRQTGTDLVAFQTAGNALLLARAGTPSAAEMFKIEDQESSTKAWGGRLLGGCLMLAGWVMVLWRLVPALLVGGLIGAAVIAGPWLGYRPFEAAIALMVTGIAATIAVIRRWLPRFVSAG
jgi:hypothetical protein